MKGSGREHKKRYKGGPTCKKVFLNNYIFKSQMFSTERSKGERKGAVRNRTQKGQKGKQGQGKERERRRQEGEEWHGKVVSLYCIQGDQMFLLKNRPKTIKNRPKSCPNIFLLVFLYKTVLWCFLFDFMLISNGTGHSFIVFFYKKEINFFEYF